MYHTLTNEFKLHRMNCMMNVEAQKQVIARKLKDDLNHLKLSGVKVYTKRMLGRGSFATVYESEYSGSICAVKQVDPRISKYLAEETQVRFLMECVQHSMFDHPNIVKMLGVFYPEEETLPVLVMELMEYNLTQLLKRSHNISMYVKLSILQDVSRGLRYLHAQNPPIVHQALYSDNILVTKGLTAKISDFKTGAKTISEQAVLSVRSNTNINDFLPDSYPRCDLKYELPLNVFSFGCIVCHVIIQKFPSMSHDDPLVTCQKYDLISITPHFRFTERKDHDRDVTSCTIDERSVKKHQHYINLITDNSIQQLLEACLQENPGNRPNMSQIYEKINSIMTGEFVLIAV